MKSAVGSELGEVRRGPLGTGVDVQADGGLQRVTQHVFHEKQWAWIKIFFFIVKMNSSSDPMNLLRNLIVLSGCS